MIRLIFLALVLFSSHLYSQEKGDYIWIGGTQPYPEMDRADGHITDFSKRDAKPERRDIRYGFTGNNASVSDEEGNLLFYSNGCAVMNRHHQIMPNGDSINAGRWFDIFKAGCMYGYPGFQDALILKDPGSDQGYYLFHKPNIYYPLIADSFQLQFTYIDMSLDDGRGDVVIKNQKYYERENAMYSYFTGIRHSNKKDWWIIQPIVNDSVFLTFLLDETGINGPFTQNTHQFFDKFRSSAGGSARFSPDGTKYALYNYNDQLHVYDFDRETGLLSNHQKIEIYHPDSIDRDLLLFSSVEWSPNSRFIYCASSEKLHQVDTRESNIQDGVRHIADYNGTFDPFSTRLFLMVLGPDCRIYMTPKNGSYSLHVINKPDELGTACDFVQNGIKLPNSNSGTLPNFPRLRVDEEEKCDPSITSVFGHEVYYRRDLEVYPNPSRGIYTVKLPEAVGVAVLSVTDISGAVIYEKELKAASSFMEEVDITRFPSGRYNIHVYPLANKERIFYGRQVVKL